MSLDICSDDLSSLFKEKAIYIGERRGVVAVYIDLSDDLTICINRDNDFGSGVNRAREIARIGADVVNDDCFA